ncbi:MAG: hypothetical protein IH621_07010 [Krumholzibacteria bacterium]|nr:hypothetical protein [Candidatus Krumholzibacteria bacterium]
MRPPHLTRTAPAALCVPLLLVCGLAAASDAIESQASEKYSLVRVMVRGQDGEAFLAANPELDIAHHKPGVAAEIVATPETMDLLRASGLPLEIVHEDLTAHYASRIVDKDTSFGGWHTYSENIAYLDSLRTEYPQSISAKWSIGQSHEGRDIWCVRLSSDPDVDQTGKPEVLLMTMIHAREIMSGDFGLMFADHLCANYGSDPVVTWLLDNREFYLVSIANPDGVAYNEMTNPDGGGMWCKNRLPNAGYYGVDLNSNFPYQWEGSGSSTNPSSDTYRGPFAGSEPETQALMNLVNGRQFVIAQDLHTYGNLTLFPWGYTTDPTAADALYEHMAGTMVQHNGYAPGQPGELFYTVNGGSIDWLYGAASEHGPILAFRNEAGTSSDGFWPSFSRRDELFQENLWPMLYLLMAAGPFADVADAAATDTGGGLLEPGDQGHLVFKVVNHGARDALAGVQLTLSSDDPYVQFAEAVRVLGPIAATGEVVVDPFAFSVDAACPDGHLATVNVRCDVTGGAIDYPVSFRIGEREVIVFDDFSSGTGNWLIFIGWGLSSSIFYSAPCSLTDSPEGDYRDNWNAAVMFNGSDDFSRLTFWHRFDIEDGYDYGRVQIAADSGGWQTIASYTGTQDTWQEVDLDLEAYAGQVLRLRFLLETDYSVVRDGWYIDDVTLYGSGGDNQLPPVPAAVAPAEAEIVQSPVTLTVQNVADPEGDPVTYGFRVYSDSHLTQVAAAVDDLPAGGASQTTWQTPYLDQGTYWWRAYAADSVQRGLLGEIRSFQVESAAGVGIPAIRHPQLAVVGQTGGQADLQLTLPVGSDISVRIYNLRGQLVRELFQGRAEAGARHLTWDGRDARGRQIASGVYLVRAQVGPTSLGARLVMVR